MLWFVVSGSFPPSLGERGAVILYDYIFDVGALLVKLHWQFDPRD
jgi:hypothetical protein